MFSRATPLLLLVLAVSATSAEVRRVPADPSNLVVHEWGTFTSIAGLDGRAVPWMPLDGQSDLPCFVYRYRQPKSSFSGSVRMETPVLYFYTPQPATVDVTVRFNEGLLSEWFPQARQTLRPGVSNLAARGLESTLRWEQVRIDPEAPAHFPTEPGESHYYAARATDAAPLEVGKERDRFLFYRGVGRFSPSLTATIDADGRVAVKSATRGEPVGRFILFSNRNGEIRYRVARTGADAATETLPATGSSLALLRSELEQILIAEGLFAKEARAMVETWRDSWFEEGTRLFYLVPRPAIDAVLPLDIMPRPAAVARVFVGRMELVTNEAMDGVRDALARGDVAALAKHGRFLRPIVDRLLTAETPRADRARIDRLVDSAAVMNLRGQKTCR